MFDDNKACNSQRCIHSQSHWDATIRLVRFVNRLKKRVRVRRDGKTIITSEGQVSEESLKRAFQNYDKPRKIPKQGQEESTHEDDTILNVGIPCDGQKSLVDIFENCQKTSKVAANAITTAGPTRQVKRCHSSEHAWRRLLDPVYLAELEGILLKRVAFIVSDQLWRVIWNELKQAAHQNKRTDDETAIAGWVLIWLSLWPGGRKGLCSTFPWTIKSSLMVLWGVCWKFFPSNDPNYPRWFDMSEWMPDGSGVRAGNTGDEATQATDFDAPEHLEDFLSDRQELSIFMEGNLNNANWDYQMPDGQNPRSDNLGRPWPLVAQRNAMTAPDSMELMFQNWQQPLHSNDSQASSMLPMAANSSTRDSERRDPFQRATSFFMRSPVEVRYFNGVTPSFKVFGDEDLFGIPVANNTNGASDSTGTILPASGYTAPNTQHPKFRPPPLNIQASSSSPEFSSERAYRPEPHITSHQTGVLGHDSGSYNWGLSQDSSVFEGLPNFPRPRSSESAPNPFNLNPHQNHFTEHQMQSSPTGIPSPVTTPKMSDLGGHLRGSSVSNDVAQGMKVEPQDPTSESKKKWTCEWPDCAEKPSFDQRCGWRKHMDKHERPHTCKEPACAKLQGFTYSGGLLRHMREVHKKNLKVGAQLDCPFPNCKRSSGKPFTRRENLNEHMRRVHKSEHGPDGEIDGDVVAAISSPTPGREDGSLKRKRRSGSRLTNASTATGEGEGYDDSDGELSLRDQNKRLKSELAEVKRTVRDKSEEMRQMRAILENLQQRFGAPVAQMQSGYGPNNQFAPEAQMAIANQVPQAYMGQPSAQVNARRPSSSASEAS